jgi:hypothetical protein
MKAKLQALSSMQAPRVYTMATRPPSTHVTAGVRIYVSDATAGSKFQGWDGTSWVSLG